MDRRRLQTRFFFNLPHQRVPRTLARLNAATWQIPQIEVAPVTQQDAVIFIGDDAEDTDRKHDQVPYVKYRTNPNYSAVPVSHIPSPQPGKYIR